MLTTLSVLGVLLAIASPGLASLVAANSLSAAQNELAASMMLARGEAIKRGTQVELSALAPVAGAEFSGGWMVYVDANGNGRYDGGETIIRQHDPVSGDIRIGTVSGATAVGFSGRGFLTPSTLIDFMVCRGSAPATSGMTTMSVPTTTVTSKGYRVRLEPVGMADVAEVTTCS